MGKHVNLVKLCVGAEKVEDLTAWQNMRMGQTGLPHPRHITRMWPKREAELIAGGSLYWVFKGLILARQRILRLEEVIGQDGIRRCALVLDHQVVLTENQPRRAFQGWRYLSAEDAPRDLKSDGTSDKDTLPAELASALAEIGIR
ncbi:hypothetical protein ALP8811_01951 [Aliiroseovarius pelagivivens]|uniref:Lysophospholipase n=1 Tax=Aliiroseovarius pelagivivens TaxID=1639690 RepID=A0A2R8AM26_9RHOB|nr:DUF1489 domain-containing protein [Aliiroseovarius pelagivivens]SPF76934.1 hypothetical protein ALP8811_01951 [Aliiroseovarius pelagivivens]